MNLFGLSFALFILKWSAGKSYSNVVERLLKLACFASKIFEYFAISVAIYVLKYLVLHIMAIHKFTKFFSGTRVK